MKVNLECIISSEILANLLAEEFILNSNDIIDHYFGEESPDQIEFVPQDLSQVTSCIH